MHGLDSSIKNCSQNDNITLQLFLQVMFCCVTQSCQFVTLSVSSRALKNAAKL